NGVGAESSRESGTTKTRQRARTQSRWYPCIGKLPAAQRHVVDNRCWFSPAWPMCSLDRPLNDVANPAEQKTLVVEPRSGGEDHTHQFTLRVGPGDRAAGSTVAEGALRGQVAESVPRRGRLQTPAQAPGVTELPVLVRNHGLDRGSAQ